MSDGGIHRADDPEKATFREGLSPREMVGMALGVLVAVFAALNLEDVRVDLLAGTVALPLILVIVACSATGYVLGFLVARRRSKRR
jgi:uncharacterized integral membrane protein